jgi:hypothetical protein
MELTMDEVVLITDAAIIRNDKMYPELDKKGRKKLKPGKAKKLQDMMEKYEGLGLTQEVG